MEQLQPNSTHTGRQGQARENEAQRNYSYRMFCLRWEVPLRSQPPEWGCGVAGGSSQPASGMGLQSRWRLFAASLRNGNTESLAPLRSQPPEWGCGVAGASSQPASRMGLWSCWRLFAASLRNGNTGSLGGPAVKSLLSYPVSPF
jgi:hypothetical protein